MTTFSLRPAQEGDKWAVLEWRNHADVRAVMLTDHIISKTEHSAWWVKTYANGPRTDFNIMS
nr:hypothetical protein BCU13_23790 [Vibrio lentus]